MFYLRHRYEMLRRTPKAPIPLCLELEAFVSFDSRCSIILVVGGNKSKGHHSGVPSGKLDLFKLVEDADDKVGWRLVSGV